MGSKRAWLGSRTIFQKEKNVKATLMFEWKFTALKQALNQLKQNGRQLRLCCLI
jgi:hypothetical protein